MKSHRKCTALLACALALATASAPAEVWSRFRGPNGSGAVEDGSYPAEFGPEKNLLWKTPARPGKSSPVLTGEHIFITAFDEGKLYTQCFGRETGKLLWERAEPQSRQADINGLNEPAANSPLTDGENVYVIFRDLGLISYDATGKQRWKTPLDPLMTLMGHSSSPILAGGSLLLQADQNYGSYIAAFDPANGEIKWKVAREEGAGWATPLLFAQAGRPPQIVTASRGFIGAHSLADGKRLWGMKQVPPAIVASPIVHGDTVYVFGYGNDAANDFEGGFDRRDKDSNAVLSAGEYEGSAFMLGLAKLEGNRDGLLSKEEYLTAYRATIAPSSLVAFRFDADASPGGEAVRPPRELWRYERSFNGVIPSALVYRGVLYLIKNGGILETLDPETGDVLKRGRVRDAIEGYSASPVAADGKVYLTSEAGKISVLKAGPEGEVIAVNDLGEDTFATPALSAGKIFVRTNRAIYCFASRN